MKERTLHIRMVDQKFLNDLSNGGILSPVTESVKLSNDLMMAFRSGYINIYYRGHSLYKIAQKNGGYTVSFDFNHARYTENYQEKLAGIGMTLPNKRTEPEYPRKVKNKGKEKVISGNNTISKYIFKYDSAFWANSLPLLKGLIDDYYAEDKAKDYFMAKVAEFGLKSRGKKSQLLEKRRQQQIALANCFTENGYFVYDIEYAEPKGSGEKLHGRFDMLAVKVSNAVAEKLLLIELKSTKEACEGTSGIENHRSDMAHYLDPENDKARDRIAEAHETLDALSELFGNAHVDCSRLKASDVSHLFVLTDEAKKYCSDEDDTYTLGADSSWKLEKMRSQKGDSRL